MQLQLHSDIKRPRHVSRHWLATFRAVSATCRFLRLTGRHCRPSCSVVRHCRQYGTLNV